MTQKSLFPYYTQSFADVKGIAMLDIGGAAVVHIDNIDDSKMQNLMYPCRIDAIIMVVCIRGEVSFSSHMNSYTLRANQLFISSASVFQFHALAGSEFYMFAFGSDFLTGMNVDLRFVARVMSQLRINTHIASVPHQKMDSIVNFFLVMYATYGGSELNEYMDHSLRHVFCAMLYRVCDVVIGDDAQITPVGVKERSSEYFEKLMSLLSEHYREQRNVEFYAEKMHISSKHLSRVIRNFTGRSVHQWIDEFVALEIKNLLKYSNMSIQQISYSLNFPNPSFMGQYFKRITGMTPGEYKRS